MTILRRRLLRGGLVALLAGALPVICAAAWTRIGAAGRVHSAGDAPSAPVAIVFGAQLAPGGAEPKPFLAGRLDVAAELVRSGRARAILVSGDAGGRSGDEIQAMTRYLVARGIPERRIVADPYGLDSYDTCRRAVEVYGVRRALLVTQAYHLPRSVTLCRRLGVDAHGVRARCDGCRSRTLARNAARESLATVKAALDAVRLRRPAVTTPPTDALAKALQD